MSIENPSPEIIEAIEAAVDWYERSKITGIRVVSKDGGRAIVRDPKAPPLWARFYEPKTGRPIFAGRDGVIRYSLEEIEKERTTGYQWYSRAGERVLEEYAKWKKGIKIKK